MLRHAFTLPGHATQISLKICTKQIQGENDQYPISSSRLLVDPRPYIQWC